MPPLLQLRDIAKDFGGLEVLRGISLDLNAGETRCIIGPNGCGKTTLFNIISGAFPPASGKVIFRGEDITGRAPHHIARLGIARKFQVPGIYPTLSVAENLEAARLGMGNRPRSRRNALGEVLDRNGLAQILEQAAGTLSHGQKQWLEIAMLLCMDATLLLLDEPTAGMTASETVATAELIKGIAARNGVAVLVIEHDMSFVRQLVCPVIVTLRGTVIFQGSYAQAQARQEVRDAYLGSLC